jgi:formylglycine-generating enzyme required for sulfatase activity
MNQQFSIVLILLAVCYTNFAQSEHHIVSVKMHPSMAHKSSLDIPVVYVEGGTFRMGSNNPADHVASIHRVTLSSFYMSTTEITEGQWNAVMDIDSSYHKNCDDCPVENVSWFDVQDFIEKLNAKTGKTYRLPTEAEWEYAAKGGNKSQGYMYSGSNEYYKVGWFKDNSDGHTHPVGQKQANELGLYDMTGNVHEWCSDWYNPNYYSHSPSINPKGPSTGTLELTGGTPIQCRVFRGGSYYDNCDVSLRNRLQPGVRCANLGFRLVLVP